MLAPFSEHFHPSVHRLEQRNNYLDTRKIGNPVTAITLTPLEHQVGLTFHTPSDRVLIHHR